MNLKPKIKIIVLLTFGILLLWNIKSMAASVSVSAPGTVSPNGTFTVKVTGNDAIGKFKVTVSGGSSSTNEVWVEGSTSFSVQAGSSGTVKVSLSPIDVSNSSGAEVTPSGSASVTVSSGNSNSGNSGGSSNNNAAPTTNPMITSLGITPYDYDFSNYKVGTATGTTFYASVPNDVTSINIYANTQAGGTISGTGAKNLNEGTNKFTVSNGYYTYYISVNRKTLDGTEPANKDDDEEEEEESEEEKDAGIGIKTLIIEDYKLEEEFKSDVLEYTVKVPKKLKLDELKEIIQSMTVILNADNVVYEATPKILGNGDGVITILVRDELKEYSIYTITFVSENAEENDGIVGAVIPNNDKSNINGMFGLTNEQQIYIILGAFGITSLMALVFAISSYTQYLRLAEYEDEYEEEEEDEEQEDLETIEDRNYSEFEKINKYRDSVRQDSEPKKEEVKEEPAVSLAEEKEEEKEESNLGKALNFERKLMGFRGLKSERKSGGKHF